VTVAAKVYGELVIELPHDLYIPPDALEIVLEAFEGLQDNLQCVGRDVEVVRQLDDQLAVDLRSDGHG